MNAVRMYSGIPIFICHPESKFLIAFTRVINPHDEVSTLYWWTNIAVPEAPDVRVLAPTSEALYIDREIKGFGQAQLPLIPTYQGKDATYPVNSPHSNEFFFQCQKADIPWEAALDRNGEGLIEASTPRLSVRKLFCWGMNQGGRHWQEFLSIPGKAYIEIQAGLAPTQLHSLPFEAGDRHCWTEVFGYIKADPAKVHGSDWEAAWRAVDQTLKSQMTAMELAEIEEKCLLLADIPSHDLIQTGSGWGALELERKSIHKDGVEIPGTFVFPAATLGKEQMKWIRLLKEGVLPEQPPDQIPGDWMVQRQWRDLLRQKPGVGAKPKLVCAAPFWGDACRRLQRPEAVAVWEASIEVTPSIWAYRNLAVLARSAGKTTEAIGL